MKPFNPLGLKKLHETIQPLEIENMDRGKAIDLRTWFLTTVPRGTTTFMVARGESRVFFSFSSFLFIVRFQYECMKVLEGLIGGQFLCAPLTPRVKINAQKHKKPRRARSSTGKGGELLRHRIFDANWIEFFWMAYWGEDNTTFSANGKRTHDYDLGIEIIKNMKYCMVAIGECLGKWV